MSIFAAFIFVLMMGVIAVATFELAREFITAGARKLFGRFL